MSDALERARLARVKHDWPVVRIKHVAQLIGGGTPSKDNAEYWVNGSIPWASPKDMKRRTITETEDQITEAAVLGSATTYVDEGSPLLVVRSGILRHTLPVAIAGRRLTLNQDMKAFRLSDRLTAKFFVYWVEGQGQEFLLEWRQFGATVESIDTRQMMNGRIALPDIASQKAIADFLDRETTRIDRLIEKKERLSRLLQERWFAALDRAIRGDTQAETLPPGWKTIPLKHLTDDRRPIMYGIVLPGPNVDDGVMIVKGGDVKPGRLHPERLSKTTYEIESRYERSRLKQGDLIISIRGGIGDVEIVPASIENANLTQDAARISTRKYVHNVWLRYALQAPSVFAPLAAKSLGAAVRGINIFDLKRVLVPVPPLSEQHEIADRLVTLESLIAALQRAITDHTVAIREYRAALITAAVTGQIDVATWGKRGETDRLLDTIARTLEAEREEAAV